MKPGFWSAPGVVLSLLFTVSPAHAALPVVNSFTTVASSNSPVRVTAFTASDSDGTVVGYMCTDNSTRPSASSPSWTSTPPQSCSTTKNGSVTLYGWAKDNANGVSNGKAFTTWVPGVHTHAIGDVTGLQAALDTYQKRYAKVLVVSTDGNGDFTDPKSAVDSIQDASATNPYLVKLLPGLYDLGTQVIELPNFVHLEGSGVGATVLTGNGNAIVYLRNSSLRSMTIQTGPGQPGLAIWAAGTDGAYGADVRLEDLAIRIFGTTTSVYSNGVNLMMRDVSIAIDAAGGYAHGIVVDTLSADLRNVEITVLNAGNAIAVNGIAIALRDCILDVACSAQGYCRGVDGGNVSITNSEIRVSSGVAVSDNGYGPITVAHSRLSGPLALLADSNARVSFSELSGGVLIRDPQGPSMRCFSVHDENYDPLICP